MSELLFCPWCKKISSKMSENGYCQKCFEAKIIRYIPQTELTDLKAKYQKAKRAIDFYATYSPFQFPEGYYEICIEKGVGGHNKFGTLARKTLAELEEKE